MLPRPKRRAIHPLRRAAPARAPAPDLGRPTPLLLIAAPRGIEDYFHQINTASTDDQHRRIGEGYGIHAAPRPAGETRACLTCLVAAQNDPICTVSMLITIKAELVQNGGSRA